MKCWIGRYPQMISWHIMISFWEFDAILNLFVALLNFRRSCQVRSHLNLINNSWRLMWIPQSYRVDNLSRFIWFPPLSFTSRPTTPRWKDFKSFQESLGHWVPIDPSYLEQESLNGSLSALGPNQSGNTTKKCKQLIMRKRMKALAMISVLIPVLNVF